MKRLFHKLICIVLLIVVGSSTTTFAKDKIEFDGNRFSIFEITPDKNTGLDKIYVLRGLTGVSITYTADSNNQPVWYEYGSLGGGYATKLSSIIYNGNQSTLSLIKGDCGYIIEEGDFRYYFWITDYTPYDLRLKSINIPSNQDCDMVQLQILGQGAQMRYTTIHGQSRILDRQLQLSYYTLDWDNESKSYQQVETTKQLESFSEQIFVNPSPLCDTRFTLTGDRFLNFWGEKESVESQVYHPVAVDVHTYADQVKDLSENSNQISSSDSDMLGGSAPADITFYAITTDGVIHNEWQIAKDDDFENILYRFNERDLNYIFRDEGVVYVRYIGSNSDGSCEAYSDVYTVSIGSSELKCPNAFSPGASEGVNDEWKVSYRSIIDFKCSIFDRTGKLLFHFTNPADGWDGKYNDKYVKPGVYYYVIEARGADGKKYNRNGDINIIRYRTFGSSSANENTDL